MASAEGWRAALTASERYENIQKIEKAARPATLTASAYTLENDAYGSASSREDYDAACALLSNPPVDATGAVGHGAITETEPEETPHRFDGDEGGGDQGLQIGRYTHCRYVASGVTADVYRSGARALKVITVARDMQPHDHLREAQILRRLHRGPGIISLIETFHDVDQRFVLVFPYMPLSLDAALAAAGEAAASQHQQGQQQRRRRRRRRQQLLGWFADVFAALAHIHGQGILHRDVKPSAVLLATADGPAYLSDFGTAWHPALSAPVEPADSKVLDIGTGPYRAPEVLFGNQAYGPSVDMWAAGAMLAEAAADGSPIGADADRDDGGPSGRRTTLFASRPAHEDGSQLGLILSIFKTIGTPTHATWPEAAGFRTPPFAMYREFPARPWDEVLPGVDGDIRQLVARLIQYNSTRATAEQALAAIREMQACDGAGAET